MDDKVIRARSRSASASAPAPVAANCQLGGFRMSQARLGLAAAVAISVPTDGLVRRVPRLGRQDDVEQRHVGLHSQAR